MIYKFRTIRYVCLLCDTEELVASNSRGAPRCLACAARTGRYVKMVPQR